MSRDEIIAVLKSHEADLQRLGVLHAALSRPPARTKHDDDGKEIRILVDLDPAAGVSVYDYIDLKEYLDRLFPEPVDLINRDSLKQYPKPHLAAAAVYAF